jgi:hypothetical protein
MRMYAYEVHAHEMHTLWRCTYANQPPFLLTN